MTVIKWLALRCPETKQQLFVLTVSRPAQRKSNGKTIIASERMSVWLYGRQTGERHTIVLYIVVFKIVYNSFFWEPTTTEERRTMITVAVKNEAGDKNECFWSHVSPKYSLHKGDIHSHDDIRNVVFVLICLYNWNSWSMVRLITVVVSLERCQIKAVFNRQTQICLLAQTQAWGDKSSSARIIFDWCLWN